MVLDRLNMMFYELWLWIGAKYNYLRRYNNDRHLAMEKARNALEEAFTPQLKKMLEEKFNDK